MLRRWGQVFRFDYGANLQYGPGDHGTALTNRIRRCTLSRHIPWTLAQVTQRFHWICYAYCLMNNHYHLVIETPDGNLSKGMRQLNGVYTQAFNKRHGR